MQTFISVIKTEKTSRTYSWTKTNEYIYRVINNVPEYVGNVDYNTASFRGRDSAVMNELTRQGHLPKKLYWYYKTNTQFKIINL